MLKISPAAVVFTGSSPADFPPLPIMTRKTKLSGSQEAPIYTPLQPAAAEANPAVMEPGPSAPKRARLNFTPKAKAVSLMWSKLEVAKFRAAYGHRLEYNFELGPAPLFVKTNLLRVAEMKEWVQGAERRKPELFLDGARQAFTSFLLELEQHLRVGPTLGKNTAGIWCSCLDDISCLKMKIQLEDGREFLATAITVQEPGAERKGLNMSRFEAYGGRFNGFVGQEVLVEMRGNVWTMKDEISGVVRHGLSFTATTLHFRVSEAPVQPRMVAESDEFED